METEQKQSISKAKEPTAPASTASSPQPYHSPSANNRHLSAGDNSPDLSSLSSASGSVHSRQSSLSHGFSPAAREDDTINTEPDSIPGKPPSPPPVTVINRSVQEEPNKKAVTKSVTVEADGEVEEVGSGKQRFKRPSLSILKRARRKMMVKKAALGMRICGFISCLVSLSVMAADRNKGWAVDSFHRYKEFRYSITVTTIGFVYSGAQSCDLAYRLASGGNSLLGHRHHYQQLRYYFDFAFDQMLTYLLMSSSSSAATRADDWKSNWGKDKFPDMASASVAMSFLAFLAFASTSLISGYVLCSSKST